MVGNSCLLTGTKIALIVEVHAIGDSIEAARRPEFFHQRKQFIFAEEAALRIIAHIFRTVKFRGRDYFKGNRLFLGESNCIGKLGARQAGRVGDDRQHVFSQRLMRSPSQVGGVNTAGVGDEERVPALLSFACNCALFASRFVAASNIRLC